ncbi:hypothetical protein [Devosia epidermidihirudinis]|nr:hypothetical protein [Devosia epidermidihirudinis]
MALILHPVFLAIFAIFGTFAVGTGYGLLATRNIVAPGARDHRD